MKGTREENEEIEKLLDEYKQKGSKGKEILMILKGKINEEFQNEEKIKKSQNQQQGREEKERRKQKQKVEFARKRIQARERKLKLKMEERLTMEKMKVEIHAIMNETGNDYKMNGKINSVRLLSLELKIFDGNI